MLPRRFTCAVFIAGFTAAFVAAGCATASSSGPDEPDPPAWGAAWEGLPGVGSVRALPLAHPDLRGVVLTVYPAARRAEYGDALLPLHGALRVDESSPEVDARLRAAGLEIGWRELPAEGYVLATSWEDGRAVVVSAARDRAGRTWADLALEQITHDAAGVRSIRACRILDAPVFPLRGNKRPQTWERRYRANFAWEAKDGDDYAERELVATVAPGSPLDATTAGVERVLARWRPWQDRGVRRFCLKFDDVGFDLTPASRAAYGEYPSAVRAFVAAVRDGLVRRDPGAIVYYLPQTYWWADERLPAFADALRWSGGIDPDVGLVMTGPEIVSEEMDETGLAAARLQFGLVATPALLYDNLGREGDWGPLTGRDPRLRTQCEGVFGERGTPVHRLTRLDWLWNPHDYDAERSWRRALLELAGPAGYEAFRDVCAAFRRGAPRDEAAALLQAFRSGPGDGGALERPRLVALLRDDLGRLPRATGDAARPVRSGTVR